MATIADRIKSARSNTTASSGSSRVVELLRPRLSPIVEQRRLDDERKKKEEQIKKSQEEAQRYANEAGTGAIIANTVKGLNPFTKEGRSNIGQGIVNVGSAIVNPIDTAKKIGGVVKDFATGSAQETAYDIFYQKKLDEQNLKTIQENNQKVLGLNEAIKNTQDEAEKEKLKRHAKIYLEFNQRLAEETGGELKDKTNLQLAGQALGTALDLTPFLGFGSLGTKAGLKTLEKVGVKSAGKVLGRTLPKTGRELTKEAVAEGGIYGGLSGFGAGIEQKDPTIKSVGLSTAIGTGLGAGGGGVLSTIFSRLGSKAPRLKKAIDEGKIDESEIEKIFEEDGISGVEEVIKPEPRKLKAGEFAPISKEIQETTGKKLTAKETLKVKDKIEQGYTKEEIIDEIINPRRTEPTPKSIKTTPKRTELTSKPPKVESDIPTPEVDDIAEYVKNKSTKFRVADEGDDLVSQAKKMKAEGKSFDEFVKAQGTPVYRGEYTRKQTVSDSVSTSLDRRVAESFAEKGNVSEMIVDKNAKIVDLSDLRKEILGVNKLPDPSTLTKEQFEAITGNKLINYAKSKGYDVIDKSKAGIKSSGIKAGDVLDEQEFQVLNKDVLKTKSKLTDIWNKVNTKSDPLIQEAKKYKSAEEFVKAQENKMIHHGTFKMDGEFSPKGTLYGTTKEGASTYGSGRVESFLPKEGRVLKVEKELMPKEWDKIIAQAKKDGYDFVEGVGTDFDGNKIPVKVALDSEKSLVSKSQLIDIWNKEQEKFRVKDDLAKVGIKELISGKATKKVTPKIESKKGESITAKKLNEVMPDEYKINEDYDKITLKGELDRASKEIAKNKDEALRKAFSRDERVDRRIAKLEEFAQIAKDNKDYEAVNRLFTQANKIGTETAQGLNMLKALYAVNPEYKYMQEIINARLAKVKFGVKDIEKATKEVREIISRKGKDLKEKTKQAFKVKDAQELLNSIMCK